MMRFVCYLNSDRIISPFGLIINSINAAAERIFAIAITTLIVMPAGVKSSRTLAFYKNNFSQN